MPSPISVLWCFIELARDVMGMFGSGMSHALTLLPTLQGETGVLKYDLLPIASEQGWETLYHSFMEGDDSDKAFAFLNTMETTMRLPNAGCSLLRPSAFFLRRCR